MFSSEQSAEWFRVTFCTGYQGVPESGSLTARAVNAAAIGGNECQLLRRLTLHETGSRQTSDSLHAAIFFSRLLR